MSLSKARSHPPLTPSVLTQSYGLLPSQLVSHYLYRWPRPLSDSVAPPTFTSDAHQLLLRSVASFNSFNSSQPTVHSARHPQGQRSGLSYLLVYSSNKRKQRCLATRFSCTPSRHPTVSSSPSSSRSSRRRTKARWSTTSALLSLSSVE